MLDVRIIEPEATYNIRHIVLRPHQTMEECRYHTDHENNSFHIGVFSQGRLISVASFCIENNPDFPIEIQYRLRAMATIPEYRKLGAGKLAVSFGEKIIRDYGINLIWCKGRTSVQEYYNKLGFKVHGKVFDYPPIGPHIIMYKNLDSK